MSRFSWIMKEIYKDGKKNFKWVLKGAGLVLLMIFFLKVLMFFGVRDLFLPLLGILFPLGMIYYWYSMSYDDEQKKIMNKLKEEE